MIDFIDERSPQIRYDLWNIRRVSKQSLDLTMIIKITRCKIFYLETKFETNIEQIPCFDLGSTYYKASQFSFAATSQIFVERLFRWLPVYNPSAW